MDVFSIPELFETILLQLDQVTLLVSAQRVSKSWEAFINTSVPLQQSLYLCPEWKYGGRVSLDHGSSWTINPLLRKTFGHCFFETGTNDGYLLRANSFYSMPWTFDRRKTDIAIRNPNERPSEGPSVQRISPLELHQIQLASRKMRRKGASWRRMLVSQPPPSHIGYLYINNIIEPLSDPLPVESSLASPPKDCAETPGLRMGTLYDFVQARAGQYTNDCCTSFRVIWAQPREPMRSTVLEQRCKEFLQRNCVVVEVSHTRGAQKEEARDAKVFDRRFRCKDHLDIQAEGVQKDFDAEYALSLNDPSMVVL